MEISIGICRATAEGEPDRAGGIDLKIEVEETTAEDAPLAAVVRDCVSGEAGIEWKEHPVRTYKSRLYGRMLFGSVPHGMPDFWESRNLEPSEELIGKWFVHEAVSACYRSAASDGGDAVREAASNLLLVDERWYMAIGEPRYVVQTFGLGHNHASTAYFVETEYNPNIPHWRYFSANRFDDLKASVLSVAEKRGDTESAACLRKSFERGLHPYIDVRMPEAFKLNPEVEHGDGDGFMNEMEQLIDKTDSVPEACMLAIICSLL